MAGIVADRVVVELEAKLDRYNANVTQAMRVFQSGTTQMRADAARAEQQITRNFDGIKKALLASTGVFAGAAGLRAIQQLADGYTRFTNQLKLAGNEGSKLAEKQDVLFGIAQKYGVQLEAIGTLYGRVSQASKELGTNESDVLRFTQAVAAALKVQGGAASESRGALLQLSQMLGAPIVQAQEFNSVLDGARPIIQAVANGIDRYGGSIAKLRMDVINGKVTSQDFFQGFLRGSQRLEEQASRANLTIGASFTVLNNALGRYVGQTDQALSLTARFSQGIGALANNLDIIVPALAGIAAGYAAVRLGSVVFDAVAVATSRALEIDKELSVAILSGNASYVSRSGLVVAAAEATTQATAAEVAALETTVAARQADVAAAAEQVAAAQTLIAAAGTEATAREALVSASVQATEADAALVAAETALAGAQARAAVAAEAEAVAVGEATVAKRAGVAITALFSGTLSTMGAALPFLAVAALTAAIIYYATTAKDAAFDTEKFKNEGEDLNAHLKQLDVVARNAASAVAQVGNTAATSAGQMIAFAGAVGDAAQKLYELARARRHELLTSLKNDEIKAGKEADEASARMQGRAQSSSSVARFGYLPQGTAAEQANAADLKTRNEALARQRAAQTAQARAAAIPLSGYTNPTEREHRDVEGELARVTRDLTVARERGIRSQVDTLQAQQFELKQYIKYRGGLSVIRNGTGGGPGGRGGKGGGPTPLSPQAAADQAAKDRAEFEAASHGAAGDRAAKAGAVQSRREAAAAKAAARHQAALEHDAIADEARYTSQVRQSENDIATAKADLSNSAAERAQIEKARIEDDRINRNEQIRLQEKEGQLGTGAPAHQRALELQSLNDQHAALATQVVDQHERQRIAAETVDVNTANLRLEQDMLKAQEPLADTNKERRNIALRLLDLQYEQERIELEAVTVANGRTETEQKIAQARLHQLNAMHQADAKAVDRQYEGVGQAYLRGLNAKDINEQLNEVKVDGLKSLDDALTNTIAKVFNLGGAFGKVADQIIADLVRIAVERMIIQPLANALFGGSGSDGSGGMGGILGSLFGKGSSGDGGIISALSSATGKASGGHVNAGVLYRVNESGVEGFRPAGSGQVVPLGQMHGQVTPAGVAGGSPSIVRLSIAPSEYFDLRVQSISGNVAVETVRLAAPNLTDLAVAETFRQASRPEL